jgi:hypothetical protein
MLQLEDIEIIESVNANGFEEFDGDTYYRSIQRAINEGAWILQGSYGRDMMEAINDGYCLLGKKQFTDFYGHIIPSRFQVLSHTKGSMEFVELERGKDWLEMMVEV